jgi:hypothetical protein
MHRIPDAASPGLASGLGRGLYYLRVGIELIADSGFLRSLTGDCAARAW